MTALMYLRSTYLGNHTAAVVCAAQGCPASLSGTRGSLEIPAAAQRSTRYRAPLPDAAHAIAAEAI